MQITKKHYLCNQKVEMMQNKGQVTIHIEGKYGAEKLTPENYDITLMQSVLEYAIALLDLDKRKETPTTTFHIENGSVNNVFTTSKQKAVEFASVLALITSTASIDQLDAKTAVAFEGMQRFAIQNNFNIDVSTSESKEHVVRITPQTYFKRTESVWADAEVYYYGTIVDAGGKNKSNIHLDTKDGLIMIDADKDRIFDRFFQSASGNRMSMGSGIGLHIVREYVRLQGGDITVSDQPEGTGSVFRFTIPLRKNNDQSKHIEEVSSMDNRQKSISRQSSEIEGLPTLLLVEDNKDFLAYMKQSLEGDYNIMTAINGVEALDVLSKKDVDMITSDVMMPEMDGLELCYRVKTDINTSHIPVILLTAKSMAGDELEGLEAGADDYITKPFSMEILRQRIHKLVERNQKQHERFAKEVDIEPSEITVTSLDEQFIAQAISIVEAHISDSDFGVEELSNEMGVHRSQLYKKLYHLTGKTPVLFVRLLRLKRGKQLLEQSGMYVSEVAYQVGFNSPRLFSKYFKEEFGVTPKEMTK